MSFPPNLGITNSFIIDSSCLIFQEFPSLLPQLDHICSPFSKHRMNGYSRIKKSTSNRSKSVDFADLSLARSSSTTTPNWSKFKSQGTTPVKITTVHHNSIPEHEHEQDGGVGEVFGAILGRKCGLISDENAVAEQEITTPLQSAAVKRSFSVRRSSSLSDGYSRIHHQLQSAEDGDQNGIEFSSGSKCNVKKKGKFFRVFRRLFGL